MSEIKTLDPKAVTEFIANSTAMEGHIFHVTFVKRTNGELREMECRLSSTVEKGKTGEGMKFNPFEKELIPVLDMSLVRAARKANPAIKSDLAVKGAFRMINTREVLRVRADGETLEAENG